ncbi:phage tail length tape measure family protein [Chenggangzhangella methanolivorans]
MDRVKRGYGEVASAAAAAGGATETSARRSLSASQAWDRLEARTDPVARVYRQLTRDISVADRALGQGVISLDAYGAAVERMKRGIESAGVVNLPAVDQSALNASLGVLPDSMRASARESASAFEAEFARLDDIARMRAEQAGRAFRDSFDRSIGIGAPSATSAGATFGALDELAQREAEIEAARRAQAAATAQASYADSFGIGRVAPSARASAGVFEDALAETERMEAAASALRAQLDPLSVAQARLNAEIAEYRGLAAAGVITTRELDGATAMAQGRFNETAQRIDRMGKAAGGQAFQWGNLSYQINDAATMALSGSGAFQILATQGGQVFQILQDAPGGVVGGLKEIGSAALGLLTPVNMIGVGMVAATAGIAAWSLSGGRAVESLDDSFKRHADTIREVNDLYGVTGAKLDELADRAPNVLDALAQINLSKLRAQIEEQTAAALRAMGSGSDQQPALDPMGFGTGFNDQPVFSVDGRFGRFRAEIETLRESFRQGTPDVLGFVAAISDRRNQSRFEDEKQDAEALLGVVKDLEATARRLPSALDATRGQDAVDERDFFNFQDRQRDLDFSRALDRQNADDLAQTAMAFDLRAITARTTAQRAALAADRAYAEAIGDVTQAHRADAAAADASRLVYAQAAREQADFTAGRNEAARQRTAGAELELASIGASAAASDNLRFTLDAVAEARRRAYDQTGSFEIGAAELERIRREADVWSGLQQIIRETKLAYDLANEARRAGMTRSERSVYDQLDRAGMLTAGEIATPEARAMADRIRATETYAAQTQLVRELTFETQQLQRTETERAVYARMNGAGLLDQYGEISGATNKAIADQIRLNETLGQVQQAYRGIGREAIEALASGDFGGLAQSFLDRTKNLMLDRAGEQLDNMLMSSVSSMFGGSTTTIGSLFAGKPDGSSAARALFVQMVGSIPGLPGAGGLPFGIGGVPSFAGLAANNNYISRYTGLTAGPMATSITPNSRVSSAFGAMDWLTYANQGATRSQPLDPKLVNAFSFLQDRGIQMEVFSGGQPGIGSGLPRVGSTRHDHGMAADVFFSQNGRRLDWANPQDQPIFQDIVSQARANGVTGFGAGPGYMQPGSMHVGYGSPGVWGAGGRGATAPSWLRNAYNSPAPTQSIDPGAVNAANQNVQQFGASVGQATPQVSTLGGNLGQLTQSIGQTQSSLTSGGGGLAGAASNLTTSSAQVGQASTGFAGGLQQGFGSILTGLGSIGSSLGGLFGGGGGGGLLGGLLIPGILHSGGTHADAFYGRAYPASAFRGAPRYHTGFGSNEFPAVLERSERVLTGAMDRRATRAMAGLSEVARRGAPAAANDRGGGGRQEMVVRVMVDPSGEFDARVEEVSKKTTARGIRQFSDGPDFTAKVERAQRRNKTRRVSGT